MFQTNLITFLYHISSCSRREGAPLCYARDLSSFCFKKKKEKEEEEGALDTCQMKTSGAFFLQHKEPSSTPRSSSDRPTTAEQNCSVEKIQHLASSFSSSVHPLELFQESPNLWASKVVYIPSLSLAQ
jgi:hypothetical protein